MLDLIQIYSVCNSAVERLDLWCSHTKGEFIKGHLKEETVTRYLKDTMNCMIATDAYIEIGRAYFDVSKSTAHAARNYFRAFAAIPLATRGLVFLSERFDILKAETKFVDQNIGKILHVATLVASVSILNLAKGTTTERIVAGCIIAFDASSMYRKYKQNGYKFFT